MIRWVREGLFHPDSNRAEYFPSGHPASASSAPGPNFQPRTPAFIAPVVAQQTNGPTVSDPVGESAPVSPEVKQELFTTANVEEVIEIESDDTDSSTSTSNPEDASSGDDEAFAAEAFEPSEVLSRNDQEQQALVKHCKSRIVHTVPSLEPFKSDSKYENSELMQNKFTACGRNVSKFFENH